MASTTGKTNPQYRTASRRPMPRNAPSGKPARPSREPVPQERYRTGTAKPKRRRMRSMKAHIWDTGVFFSVLLLLITGLIALFSASYTNAMFYKGSATYFIMRQGIFAAIGLAAMIALSKFPYRMYAGIHNIIMWISVALLILVAIPGIGTSINNARRWLFGFQPSEIAKLTVIICFSYWVARDPKSVRSVKTMVQPYGLLLAMYIGLLYLEPHTSAMVIICGIGVIILLAGGMRLWYFAPILGLGAGAVAVFYVAFPHVRTRFEVWLNPFSDMADKGLQGSMSQIAIGSGGLLGRGLGNGLQKQLYLPEPHNDFIFATWCEEMGLIGALLVILLFAYLIYRGFRVARYAPDKFGSLLATGITAKLAIQTLMNLFVVTGIMPVTGAALPFFSYGGTALLLQLGEMGILLNISRYMRIDGRNQD